MILFDLVATQPNSAGKRHGGGKYGEIVLKHLIARGHSITCYYDSSLWLNPDIRFALENNQIALYDIREGDLSSIVNLVNPDLLYSPLISDKLLCVNECKVAVTIHGLRQLEVPQDYYRFFYRNNTLRSFILFFYELFFRKRIIRKSLQYYKAVFSKHDFHVITVSNHSAASFKSFFPTLKAVELPVFYSPSTIDKVVDNKLFSDKYFLIVNANRWMKNALRGIIALDELFSQGFLQGYRVKVSGVDNSAFFKYRIRNIDRFDFLGYVDEAELRQLYHDAYCLLYLSLNEGFGYPPLEAMLYGVPVIASSFSAISEVCEGAALYTNPFDIFEIKNRLIQIENNERHQYFSSLSLKQYKKVSRLQSQHLDALVDYLENLINL